MRSQEAHGVWPTVFRCWVLGSRPRPVPLLQILYPRTNVRGQVQSIWGVSQAWVLHTWTDVDRWLKGILLGLFLNLKAGSSCCWKIKGKGHVHHTCRCCTLDTKYVIVVFWYPKDVGLKLTGLGSIKHWRTIGDNKIKNDPPERFQEWEAVK